MTSASPGVRQVSVAEAAALLGVSVDTVKRRVRSGALQSTRTAQGRVLVSLPEEGAAPHAVHEPPSASQDAPHLQGNDAEMADLLARVTAVTAERDWLRERVERAESEREQLRILLSNAQQSLVRALQAAPQGAPEPPQASSGAPVPQELPIGPLSPFPVPLPPTENGHGAASWWRRWRVWLAIGLVVAAVGSASCQTAASVKHAGMCSAARSTLDGIGDAIGGQPAPNASWPAFFAVVQVAEKVC